MSSSKTTGINIRPWSDKDISSIRNVIWDTWIATYSSFIPERDLAICFNEWYGEPAIRTNLADPLVEGFVAEEASYVLASMRCRWSPEEGRYFVGSLYVLPKAQGRGIGRRMMETAARSATARHQDRVWLGVMEKNLPAVEWYTRFGFTVTERLPFRMGETTIEHFIGSILVEKLLKGSQSTNSQKPNHK